MASRLSLLLLRRHHHHHHLRPTAAATIRNLHHPSCSILQPPQPFHNGSSHFGLNPGLSCILRSFSTATRRNPTRPKPVDIGSRARQLQTRRLWTYALTFSCVAGFIVIVLNQFQDQMVFYVTPTDALEKYKGNPTRTKFRLGGLVLEGSVLQPSGTPEMEFVITDLITDMLVRFEGSLPDLFREGHSVVVEGWVKPFNEELRRESSACDRRGVSDKARNGECYFKASEVLAKHDEKYMPKEVAAAIEKNKKLIEEGTDGAVEAVGGK